ncbi:MAG: DUF4839 domain-containing protein [Lachnospiraceae bacterium]|nr:DUF4839 domain-containing protein [Lachnospiraceae bacterium]
MTCEKCGAKLNSNTKFCPECGQKIMISPKTIQLKCKECGGTMSVYSDRIVLSCPFCGSKEMVHESDKVTIERIKNQTYKEIELEKIKLENTKEQRKIEQDQQKEADKQLNNFRKGKFSKIILISFIICLLTMFTAFSNGRILSGLIAIVQVGLFAVSWLMGMGFVKEKIPRQHILFAVLGFVLIILFIKTNSIQIGNKSAVSPTITENAETDEEEGIYTYQVRNYIGKNAGSIGTIVGGYRVDEYGHGKIRIIFMAENGMLVNQKDDAQLKEYVVSGQNLQPDTNITIIHLRDRKGEPYSNLVDYQSYEEIILYVNKIGESTFEKTDITQINPTLDRHKFYVRDYVGRNSASFGTVIGNSRVDEYGNGKLRLSFASEDGTFVDANDLNILKQYIIIDQDIKANTELVLEYETDSKGEEYDNLIRTQNYEEITLKVKKLDNSIIAEMQEDSSSESTVVETVPTESETVEETIVTKQITVTMNEDEFLGMSYTDAEKLLRDMGFSEFEYQVLETKDQSKTDETIGAIEIKSWIFGKGDFSKGDKYEEDAIVVLWYYECEEIIEVSNLTVENCEDLAIVLSEKNPESSIVSSFATEYKGQTIEFDGCVAYSQYHGDYSTRYDILIYAGNYNPNSAIGPQFQFEDVNYSNLGLSFSDDINDFISIGTNLRIVAEIGKFDSNTGLFKLKPVSIEKR